MRAACADVSRVGVVYHAEAIDIEAHAALFYDAIGSIFPELWLFGCRDAMCSIGGGLFFVLCSDQLLLVAWMC